MYIIKTAQVSARWGRRYRVCVVKLTRGYISCARIDHREIAVEDIILIGTDLWRGCDTLQRSQYHRCVEDAERMILALNRSPIDD